MKNIKLPQSVLEIMKTIEAAGEEVWCVGGCVRDLLMGLTPYDYDLCSSADGELLMEIFEKVIPTGLKHGTVTVLKNDEQFEITRYRIDGDYSDNRRPDSVTFTRDITEDLARRDFTMNAIAFHPERGIFDPFSGRADIEKKLIRTVGSPEKRFCEDALRILRGIRFAGQTGFSIEGETEGAILRLAKSLKSVSAERIRVEVLKALSSDNPSCLSPLIKAGGLEHLGLRFEKEQKILEKAPKNAELRFAMLTVLCEKTDLDIEKAFKFSKKVALRISEYRKLLRLSSPNLSEIKKSLQNLGFSSLRAAIYTNGVLYNKAREDLLKKLENTELKNEPYCIEMLALSGNDLKNAGLKGEEIGKAQRLLLDAVLENPQLNHQAELMKILKEEHS